MSEQGALAFDRRHTAMTFVHTRPDMYRDDFGRWLFENWHVYEAFEREALKVRATGREHYSARTIGEYLRHHTLVAQREGEFKINDHVWPDLARLFMQMNQSLRGFFETRTAPTSGRIAA